MVDGNHYERERGGTRPISWKSRCHRCGIQLSRLPTKTLPSSSEQHTLHMLLLMTLCANIVKCSSAIPWLVEGGLRGVSRTVHGKTFQRKRLWSQCRMQASGTSPSLRSAAQISGSDDDARRCSLESTELSTSWLSSDLLTRLMAERFPFNKRTQFSKDWQSSVYHY
jgi:hypothetical protein